MMEKSFVVQVALMSIMLQIVSNVVKNLPIGFIIKKMKVKNFVVIIVWSNFMTLLRAVKKEASQRPQSEL